jgi:hypothetical protein
MPSYDDNEEDQKQIKNAKKEFVVTLLEDYGSGVDAKTFDTFDEATSFAQGTPKAMAIYRRTHMVVNKIEEVK